MTDYYTPSAFVISSFLATLIFCIIDSFWKEVARRQAEKPVYKNIIYPAKLRELKINGFDSEEFLRWYKSRDKNIDIKRDLNHFVLDKNTGMYYGSLSFRQFLLNKLHIQFNLLNLKIIAVSRYANSGYKNYAKHTYRYANSLKNAFDSLFVHFRAKI